MSFGDWGNGRSTCSLHSLQMQQHPYPGNVSEERSKTHAVQYPPAKLTGVTVKAWIDDTCGSMSKAQATAARRCNRTSSVEKYVNVLNQHLPFFDSWMTASSCCYLLSLGTRSSQFSTNSQQVGSSEASLELSVITAKVALLISPATTSPDHEIQIVPLVFLVHANVVTACCNTRTYRS